MPDRRQHRGPHPEDAQLFAPEALPSLRSAVGDLCWLLDHGYSATSALKLVGDRYRLAQRQRIAVGRCSCSLAASESRRARQVAVDQLRDQVVAIDGYNVLTTVEAALAGGVLLIGRDGVLRDMASVHGSFRKVAETLPAIELLGEFLTRCCVAECRWYLDSPVSNSGRLKTLLRETAEAQTWPWRVELVASPDRVLKSSASEATAPIVASSDSAILDACGPWIDLAHEVVWTKLSPAMIVDPGNAASYCRSPAVSGGGTRRVPTTD
jgi:hypothetical protein